MKPDFAVVGDEVVNGADEAGALEPAGAMVSVNGEVNGAGNRSKTEREFAVVGDLRSQWSAGKNVQATGRNSELQLMEQPMEQMRSRRGAVFRYRSDVAAAVTIDAVMDDTELLVTDGT